jgi:hypothetical protein
MIYRKKNIQNKQKQKQKTKNKKIQKKNMKVE